MKNEESSRWRDALLHIGAVVMALWVLAPIYLITVAAFSTEDAVYSYPKRLLPTEPSTETMSFFLNASGILESLWGSVIVAFITLAIAIAIGTPAGYALARFRFRGADAVRLVVVSTRAFPIVILSIPIAVTFIRVGLDDSYLGLALMHTALALPFTVLVTSSVFAGISEELEEAAMTLGCTPLGAFRRVSLPRALPGIAAAAIFTFVLSWNEVFAATILTLQNRTLPAQVLSSLGSSPLPYRFAGGFALVVPSLVFIFFIRRYLLGMWGQATK